ncbi:hypothetical protein BC826DRAFT_395300 [Russula brevipes]|nr:hypothetical protein BC826DRAFT_395300 [Russula brevipes]
MSLPVTRYPRHSSMPIQRLFSMTSLTPLQRSPLALLLQPLVRLVLRMWPNVPPPRLSSGQCRMIISHSHRNPRLMRVRARVRHTRTTYCWMIQAKSDLWEVRQTGGRKLMRERFHDLAFAPVVWGCLSVDGSASLRASVLPIILSLSKC